MTIAFVFFNSPASYLSWNQMGTIISSLKKEHVVKTYHVVEENIIQIANEINGICPELLVIYLKFKTYVIMQNFISHLYVNHICACHTLPTIFPIELLEKNSKINSAIVGEVENTVIELAHRINQKSTFEGLSGVAYRNANNEIILNSKRIEPVNIDRLPYADRESFKTNKKFFHILASRGCYGRCSFCTRDIVYKYNEPKHGQRFRRINDVIAEIELLVKKYDCKYIGFSDSTFCGKIDGENGLIRLKQLHDALESKDFRIEYFINLRSEQITPPVIEALKTLVNTGLSMVFVGVESFEESDLCLYNKMAKVEQNISAICLLSEINNCLENGYLLEIKYGLINFNPYSTIAGIKNNIDILVKYQVQVSPKDITNHVDIRYGTTLYQKMIDQGVCSSQIRLDNNSVPYKFLNEDVNNLYLRINELFLNYNIVIPEGFTSLFNRYIYFFGQTEFSKEIREKYQKLLNKQSYFTYKCFYYVLHTIDDNVALLDNKSIDDEKEELETVFKDFQNKYIRLVSELYKINELSYY